MGTTVLFPLDYLQPRSQHKHQTSGMIYPSEYASMSERNPMPPTKSQEAGLLPLPGHGPMNIPRRGSNTNHFKCRKGGEQRDTDYSSRSVSDVPVYKILQRPKQGDTAVNVLAQFVMLDEVKARSAMVGKNGLTRRPQNDGVDKSNNRIKSEFGTFDVKSEGFKQRGRGFDTKPVKACSKGGSVCEPKDVANVLNGVHTSISDSCKLPSSKVGAVKPKKTSSDKVQVSPDDSARVPAPRVASKPLMTKATSKVSDVSCKAGIVQHSEKHHSLLPHLRCTATEPQISMRIVGPYKSKVMHISFDNSKEFHAYGCGLSDNIPLSSQERWAGPAYTSSPSPSPLPLPKLCLPQISVTAYLQNAA